VHVDLVESEQAVDRCILLCRLQIFGSKSFRQRHSYVGNVAYIADSIVLRALHFVLAMHCRFLTVVSAEVFSDSLVMLRFVVDPAIWWCSVVVCRAVIYLIATK